MRLQSLLLFRFVSTLNNSSSSLDEMVIELDYCLGRIIHHDQKWGMTVTDYQSAAAAVEGCKDSSSTQSDLNPAHQYFIVIDPNPETSSDSGAGKCRRQRTRNIDSVQLADNSQIHRERKCDLKKLQLMRGGALGKLVT